MFNSKHIMQLQWEKSHPKRHFVTVHQDDIEWSNPGQNFNDVLVVFWASWISQNESDEEPNIFICNTQFYSTFAQEEVQHLLNWTSCKMWNCKAAGKKKEQLMKNANNRFSLGSNLQDNNLYRKMSVKAEEGGTTVAEVSLKTYGMIFFLMSFMKSMYRYLIRCTQGLRE